jgi:hypothetical protein
MDLWQTFGVAAVTAIVVAFFTTIVSEPIKMWLYRKKHIEERQNQVQLDQLPRLVEALGWAAAASQNAYSGWQAEDRKPFDYVNNAQAKIIEAINLGVDTWYLLPTTLRDEISATVERLRNVMNDITLEKNMGGEYGGRLEKPNQKIFDSLQKVVKIADEQRVRLQSHYQRLLGVN